MPHGRVVTSVVLLVAALACAAALILSSQSQTAAPKRAEQPRTDEAISKPKPAATEPRSDMMLIPGGTFWMGDDSSEKFDEKPAHQVSVSPFWMDKTEVTNEQFEKFVNATRYITVAEKAPSAKDFPDAAPEMLVPGSIVFSPPPGEVDLRNHMQWWRYASGANWRHPEGPNSNINGRERHPVVHVCWYDAVEFCKWAKKRLPTEAEWEFAARGGLDKQPYVCGSEKNPGGKCHANIWQGNFPNENTEQDGYGSTSPVASFQPNGYGIYDMAGNVWEWCTDWYRPDYYAKSATRDPKGPSDSFDPNEPGMPKRVTRGGSYLCSDLYCIGYKPAARMKTSPDTGLCHTGFRCVKDAQ